jgi:hypothetical protein
MEKQLIKWIWTYFRRQRSRSMVTVGGIFWAWRVYKWYFTCVLITLIFISHSVSVLSPILTHSFKSFKNLIPFLKKIYFSCLHIFSLVSKFLVNEIFTYPTTELQRIFYSSFLKTVGKNEHQETRHFFSSIAFPLSHSISLFGMLVSSEQNFEETFIIS